jgi:hypothetical protein
VDTYELPRRSLDINLKHKLLASALYCSAVLTVRICWDAFSTSHGDKPWSRELLGAGSFSLIFGLLMGFRPVKIPDYRLEVDDASITGVTEYTGWMKWLKIRRTVRSGRVRSIFEIKPIAGRPGGIGASERTVAGARMWGFVYLPKTLPEYESLKSLVESWRAPGRK